MRRALEVAIRVSTQSPLSFSCHSKSVDGRADARPDRAGKSAVIHYSIGLNIGSLDSYHQSPELGTILKPLGPKTQAHSKEIKATGDEDG